jgi:hypothetical protein
MPAVVRVLLRSSLLVVLLVGSIVWTGCDLASTGNTAILNAESAVPPTVRHRFEYTADDAVGEGQVAVSSTVQSEGLDAILSQNGFSRRDVVSAQVDSVRVDRLSAPALRETELFLGADAEGPLVGRVAFQSNGPSSVVDDTRRTVTGAVRNGAETLFGRFRVENPSTIPDGGGMVRAVVYYRVEVEGV